MLEEFVTKNFSAANEALIAVLDKIIQEYSAQGYRLSVRQLYYQLVARDIVENTQKSYKRIAGLVSDARLAGLIDWEMIEDRGRETITPPMWKSPAEIVLAAARQFATDRWKDQDNHVEVMVEKAALEGVLIPVCRAEGVRFTANRGYSSQSLMYETGKRLEQALSDGKDVYMIYFGDHDPSGIDMTRDVSDRLEMFCRSAVEVQRLALNWNQIEEWKPPENPAKQTDSRFMQYVELHGESSWELDAVEPATLAELCRSAIIKLRDEDLYQEALMREAEMKQELERFAVEYNEGSKKKKSKS